MWKLENIFLHDSKANIIKKCTQDSSQKEITKNGYKKKFPFEIKKRRENI